MRPAGRVGGGDRALHDQILRQRDGSVVRAVDAGHRVAEEAGHPVQLGRHRVEIEPVLRRALVDGHRRVAIDAERTELTAGLALPAGVHGQEHRIVGGIGMHAPHPFVVMLGVALLAT